MHHSGRGDHCEGRCWDSKAGSANMPKIASALVGGRCAAVARWHGSAHSQGHASAVSSTLPCSLTAPCSFTSARCSSPLPQDACLFTMLLFLHHIKGSSPLPSDLPFLTPD